ncbi:MAG TPA: HipA domain-containing protein [Mucilaginibacter sp.]
MLDLKKKLRIEVSENCSGIILNEDDILSVKEKHYYVIPVTLDGDAPKEFIKLYHYCEDSGVKKVNTNTWDSYIAKAAEKWYPHESVVEYMINRIGQVLDLRMNETALFKINTQIRFLSKYFLKKNEILIHGAEICGSYLNDNAFAELIANNLKESRALFTFEFLTNAIKYTFPDNYNEILNDLVRLITFDALTGNNDRHFYNWGIITNTKKDKQVPKFAPIYDSARGLFWNESDDNIKIIKKNLKSNNKFETYLKNACPRISVEGNSKINHFGLIDYLKNNNEHYKLIIEEIASVENEKNVYNMLNKEFLRFFISERNELILLLLKERFKKVRGE